MSKQDTAVEWLINELKSLGIYSSTLKEKCESAKAMEKEQIMESYKYSTCQFSVDSRIDCPKSAEQYYKENYGK